MPLIKEKRKCLPDKNDTHANVRSDNKALSMRMHMRIDTGISNRIGNVPFEIAQWRPISQKGPYDFTLSSENCVVPRAFD